MGARREAAPRQRDDPPAIAGRVEGQRDVDRGQAGAEQQHGVAAAQPSATPAAQGSSTQSAPSAAGSIPRGVAGRKLPGASTTASAGNVAPVGEPHRAVRRHVHRLAADDRDIRLGQQLGEIVAIEHARREILRRRRRPAAANQRVK